MISLSEAQTVADIASTADGGCSHCVSNLVEQLNWAFPQFKFVHKLWDGGENYYDDTVEVIENDTPF